MTADDLTAIEEGLSLADRIHVSTQTLAERYARFGEVHLLENAFPVEPPPLQPISDEATSLRVFYGAGRWHTPDWLYVVEALDAGLKRAAIEAGRVIEVELMGATWTPPESSAQVQYTVKPPAPWTTYLQAMSQADLALMPLEPNAHTDAKSPIKFYEAAAVGTPALALGRVYAQTIVHGVTGPAQATRTTSASWLLSFSHQVRNALHFAKTPTIGSRTMRCSSIIRVPGNALFSSKRQSLSTSVINFVLKAPPGFLAHRF